LAVDVDDRDVTARMAHGNIWNAVAAAAAIDVAPVIMLDGDMVNAGAQ
jgi:hypothetical protein